MPSYVVLIRLTKALLSLTVGALCAAVVFNNVTDYGTNFEFVKHVMSMDSVPPRSRTRWRAITSPRAHHLGYRFIIAVEALIAALCTAGSVQMLRALGADGGRFRESKRWSVAGLLAGLLLWFFGFQVLAGEWFQMWTSKEWNALPDASRLTQYLATVLAILTFGNDA